MTLVRDRHRSREFIEFLKMLDAAYPASTAIKRLGADFFSTIIFLAIYSQPTTCCWRQASRSRAPSPR